jgi:hypothetical protein
MAVVRHPQVFRGRSAGRGRVDNFCFRALGSGSTGYTRLDQGSDERHPVSHRALAQRPLQLSNASRDSPIYNASPKSILF